MGKKIKYYSFIFSKHIFFVPGFVSSSKQISFGFFSKWNWILSVSFNSPFDPFSDPFSVNLIIRIFLLLDLVEYISHAENYNRLKFNVFSEYFLLKTNNIAAQISKLVFFCKINITYRMISDKPES